MKNRIVIVLAALALACACSSGNSGTCDLAAPDCAEGLVCDPVQGGGARCVAPLTISGLVLDAEDDSPIEGALVQAVDANAAAVGNSARSDAEGRFSLVVAATRDSDGLPVAGSYTLRAQAAGYQRFPTAIRPALPLDAASAQGNPEDGWTLESALTTIKLLPLGGSAGLGSISGTVLAPNPGGVLVVAETNGRGYTGYSDAGGAYVIFNLPAGDYTVSGYRAGLQLQPASVTLDTGQARDGVDLEASDAPLSTVSGHVQIVNAPGGLTTSVVLVVESTFIESVARGEMPPGLRAGDVDTDFTISEVPDGRYVVLAAFENDQLVRDPDVTIGGTQVVHIEAPDPATGNTIELDEGFKITEALDVLGPGADGPETINTATPELRFQNDTSEDGYELYVFDAFGEQLWMTELGPASEPLSVPYAGPALVPGMYYQFKAYSFREKTAQRTYISTTEDLRGVFVYEETP